MPASSRRMTFADSLPRGVTGTAAPGFPWVSDNRRNGAAGLGLYTSGSFSCVEMTSRNVMHTGDIPGVGGDEDATPWTLRRGRRAVPTVRAFPADDCH
jgi:hypothetical protein